jgi:DMSO/TMAO reductase YedYZ molybdopterin-dependent catalytic subunit
MNKQNKITLGILAVAIIAVALAASIYFASNTSNGSSIKLPAGNPPAGELKLTGDISTQKSLTVSDLTGMPLTNITTNIGGETATYVGVSITELLNQTGASWDAGTLNIIGAENYSLTTYQALNSTDYVSEEYILAFAKNGEWLTSSTNGPFMLVAPGLTQASGVQEINLQPWIVQVDGKVANQLTLTGTNITAYTVKTIEAAFAPGGEPQRTSNWTGVTLSSILEAAGVSSNASKVTVTAIDGYSKQFTISQVESTGMMIGFQENDGYLSPGGGQPYRLVIPTNEFKWGQYWVRWVSEITVT